MVSTGILCEKYLLSPLCFFSSLELRWCLCMRVPACAVRPRQCSPGLRTTIQHQALINVCVAVITAISVAVCVCLGYLCTTTLSPPGAPRAQQLLFASMCSCLNVPCLSHYLITLFLLIHLFPSFPIWSWQLSKGLSFFFGNSFSSRVYQHRECSEADISRSTLADWYFFWVYKFESTRVHDASDKPCSA